MFEGWGRGLSRVTEAHCSYKAGKLVLVLVISTVVATKASICVRESCKKNDEFGSLHFIFGCLGYRSNPTWESFIDGMAHSVGISCSIALPLTIFVFCKSKRRLAL